MLNFGVSSGIPIFLLIENESRTKKSYCQYLPASIATTETNGILSLRVTPTPTPGYLVVFTPLASGCNAGLSVLKRYSMSAILSRAPKNRRNMAH
jgi:hypothetical protein